MRGPSLVPIGFAVDDSAAFLDNPVVFLNGVLCYTLDLSLHLSIPAAPPVL